MAFTLAGIKTREGSKKPSMRKRPYRHTALEKKENLSGYLFLLPWFVGILIFSTGPVIASLYLSFTHYDLIGSPQWIGWQNYLSMFQDPQWWDAVRVTFTYVVLSVPLKLLFAL